MAWGVAFWVIILIAAALAIGAHLLRMIRQAWAEPDADERGAEE